MFVQDFQAAGLFGLSGQETLIVLALALLLFGGKKIPEVAKGLGEGIKNFKHAMKEGGDNDQPGAKEEKKVEEEVRK